MTPNPYAEMPAQPCYDDLIEADRFRNVDQYPFEDANKSTRAMPALDELNGVAEALSPPPQLTEDAPHPAPTPRITPKV
jgi:hypothetical protein